MTTQSKPGELNRADWEAAGKSAAKFFFPIFLAYVSAVLGVLQLDGHHFAFRDLIPSQLVIDGTVIWFFMQLEGLILRLVNWK